jgi:hypothetical protein
MHDHHLEDMVKILVDRRLISGTKTNRLKILNGLKEYWEDKIAIVWQTDDIIHYAKMKKQKISKEEAIDVLQTMLRRHDCEYGISWETINANLPERRKENDS